jgi:hypothetical protein
MVTKRQCQINNHLHAIKLPRQIALHPCGPKRAPAHLDGQELLMKADSLSQGQPFRLIDDLISQAELRQISDNYKQVAGFAAKS